MKQAKIDEQRNTVEIDGEEFFIGKKASEQTPEQYFWELLGDYSTYADWKNYPGKVFIKNEEGEIVMEYIQKDGSLLVNLFSIHKKLKDKFSLNNKEISQLIKKQVEKHFGLKGVTPFPRRLPCIRR